MDAPVVVGGIIPEADVAPLREAGVAARLHAEGLRAQPDHARHRRARGGAQRRRARPRLDVRCRRRRPSSARRLRERRPARRAPAALNLVERRRPARRERRRRALLARGLARARSAARRPAHVVGITGPPGAGKSSLLSAARRAPGARAAARVAVLAVDPTSRALGRRAARRPRAHRRRPGDRGVFIRSTAAGERLGGLAPRHARGGPGAGGGVRRRRDRDGRRRAVRDRGRPTSPTPSRWSSSPAPATCSSS